jgi:anti-sigma factor RsiW
MTTVSGHLTDAQAQRLLEGLLAGERDQGVEAHVHACAECAALVESYRALGDALEGLELPALPADFTASVLERIDAVEAAARRERRLAALVVSGVLLAGLAALGFAVAGGVAPAVTEAAERLGAAARALRFTREVLPGVVSAVRVHLLIGAAAAALPLLYGLSRLMPAPRVERA